MDFQFYMPVKVIFGQDAMSQFASLAKEPVLIVSTEILTQLGVTGKVAAACGGSPAVYDQVEANPTLSALVRNTLLDAYIRKNGLCSEEQPA